MIRLLLLLSLVGAGVRETPPIALKLSPPHFGRAPCDVFVQVRIAPVPADRDVIIWTSGPDFYRSSAWGIEGEHTARLNTFWWRALPAGDYDVMATIGPPGRVRGRARTALTILE